MDGKEKQKIVRYSSEFTQHTQYFCVKKREKGREKYIALTKAEGRERKQTKNEKIVVNCMNGNIISMRQKCTGKGSGVRTGKS